MSMAERTLFTRIAEALARYTEPANAGRRFKKFLIEEVELGEVEAEKVRAYFVGDAQAVPPEEARPPTLSHGYPKQGGPFPQYALTLQGDRDSTFWIGDDGPALTDDELAVLDEDSAPGDGKAVRVTYTYAILTITQHPDVTLYYYALLKRMVRSQIRNLIKDGLDNIQLSGADMAPDMRYLPHDVFARVLTVTLDADELWVESVEGGTRGTTVSGIHVNDGESVTTGIGSVVATVTIDPTPGIS